MLCYGIVLYIAHVTTFRLGLGSGFPDTVYVADRLESVLHGHT